MKLKYSINFRVEQRKDKDGNQIVKNIPIIVDFTFNGQRIKDPIGYRVDLSQWDETKQLVKRNNFNINVISSLIINQRINTIKTHLIDIYTEKTNLNVPLTPLLIREELKIRLNDAKPVQATQLNVIDLLQLFIDSESHQNSWANGTKIKFNTFKTHLSDYKSNLQFSDITEAFLLKYIDHLGTTLNFSNSTNAKYLKMFRWFLNWASKKGYNTNFEYKNFEYKFKGTTTSNLQKNIVFLNWEELKHLNELNLSFNKMLDQTRDIYCFCCFTSLRYSDIANLKKSDFKTDNNGNYYIEILTVKNDEKLNIELNKYALAIWNKYKDIELMDNRAFPVISNQKYNKYLKDVAQFAGFKNKETVITYKGNQRTELTYEKWQLLTTHTARKTFIINALYLGIQPDIIRSWTGHKDHKTMEQYIKIVNEQKRISMNKFNEI
ncbi:MAG: phage integrase SAM-like domain-containing protein [Bacteroidetes bacterium]|nr:phage integrase SAM-like domain-containing protein [Bacteroidota bacterium]